MVLPVVRKILVEGPVFLTGDIGRIGSQYRLHFVELLIRSLRLLLLDLLSRLVVLVLVILQSLPHHPQLTDSNKSASNKPRKKATRLFNLELNRIRNEFGVLLHDLFNFFLLNLRTREVVVSLWYRKT